MQSIIFPKYLQIICFNETNSKKESNEHLLKGMLKGKCRALRTIDMIQSTWINNFNNIGKLYVGITVGI